MAKTLSKQLTYEAKRDRDRDVRSVTESRLLGLVRWARLTAGLYTLGATQGTLHILDYQQFYICRAVQAWQLTDSTFATVWIDAGHEGVHLFHGKQLALEKFALLCAALGEKGDPSNYRSHIYEGDDDDDDDE